MMDNVALVSSTTLNTVVLLSLCDKHFLSCGCTSRKGFLHHMAVLYPVLQAISVLFPQKVCYFTFPLTLYRSSFSIFSSAFATFCPFESSSSNKLWGDISFWVVFNYHYFPWNSFVGIRIPPSTSFYTLHFLPSTTFLRIIA